MAGERVGTPDVEVGSDSPERVSVLGQFVRALVLGLRGGDFHQHISAQNQPVGYRRENWGNTNTAALLGRVVSLLKR